MKRLGERAATKERGAERSEGERRRLVLEGGRLLLLLLLLLLLVGSGLLLRRPVEELVAGLLIGDVSMRSKESQPLESNAFERRA